MDKSHIFMVLNRSSGNKYIPTELKNIIYNFTIFKPKTKEELKKAIFDFCNDREQALNLYGIPNTWDVSLITDMSHLFHFPNVFTKRQFYENISNWDVSNVTDMSFMFLYSGFNGGEIEESTVSKSGVITSSTFIDSIRTRTAGSGISNWNVSNVRNMRGMFEHSHFNGDISKWDVSNVTDMSWMFAYSKFTGCFIEEILTVTYSCKVTPDEISGTIETIGSDPYITGHGLSNWDVSNVTDMSFMFHRSDFIATGSCDISKWNVSNVRNMESMFFCRYNGNISRWDVSNVRDMATMFKCSDFNGDISNWNVSNVEDMSDMFFESEFTGVEGGLSKWDVSNVTDMSRMFAYSDFNGDISNWDVRNVTNMSDMFKNSNFTGTIGGGLSRWDVRNVRDMSYMFYNSKFNGNISNWDVSNVRDMSYMFFNSHFTGGAVIESNRTVGGDFTAGISRWNISNTTNIYAMFFKTKFTGIIPAVEDTTRFTNTLFREILDEEEW